MMSNNRTCNMKIYVQPNNRSKIKVHNREGEREERREDVERTQGGRLRTGERSFGQKNGESARDKRLF
jgi:hypothetical protein